MIFTVSEGEYTIKVGTEVVGQSNPGDTFISDLDFNCQEEYDKDLDLMLVLKGRLWLLTNEADENQQQFADDAGFKHLGGGVWLKE